jgi:hypothetical protein
LDFFVPIQLTIRTGGGKWYDFEQHWGNRRCGVLALPAPVVQGTGRTLYSRVLLARGGKLPFWLEPAGWVVLGRVSMDGCLVWKGDAKTHVETQPNGSYVEVGEIWSGKGSRALVFRVTEITLVGEHLVSGQALMRLLAVELSTPGSD